MNARGPNRSASAPNRRDSVNITSVIGSSASPAPSGEYPPTCWTNTTVKNVDTPRPPYSASVVRFPTAKFLTANNWSGIIGCGTRRSHATNAASIATPAASGTDTRGSPQPNTDCSIRPNTAPPSPNTHSRPPTQSRRRAGRVIRG